MRAGLDADAGMLVGEDVILLEQPGGPAERMDARVPAMVDPVVVHVRAACAS